MTLYESSSVVYGSRLKANYDGDDDKKKKNTNINAPQWRAPVERGRHVRGAGGAERYPVRALQIRPGLAEIRFAQKRIFFRFYY